MCVGHEFVLHNPRAHVWTYTYAPLGLSAASGVTREDALTQLSLLSPPHLHTAIARGISHARMMHMPLLAPIVGIVPPNPPTTAELLA
jgi:hypothetical protein